jgi:hypothetical protein
LQVEEGVRPGNTKLRATSMPRAGYKMTFPVALWCRTARQNVASPEEGAELIFLPTLAQMEQDTKGTKGREAEEKGEW